MSIPNNILFEHIEKAIIDINPSQIPPHRFERHYLLVANNKELPPKYVISIANKYVNGVELNSEDFNAVQAKNYLINKGFNVIDKRIQNENTTYNVWIEKTLVKGRSDREGGERALGKSLWSPQRDKRGADIYKNMRLVNVGDIVLHLIDNRTIAGVSEVKKGVVETTGLIGTEWEGPAYLIELGNYTELTPHIDRSEFLTEKNRVELENISNESEVFYNHNLDLRQGAYLTPCPPRLLRLLNETYKIIASKELPFIENMQNQYSNHDIRKNLIESLLRDINKSGLQINEKMVIRFYASLLTKPFVILTGLSGSGKTKLAQAFAMWICESKSQYCIIPVGADWTNREPLLGFPNALKPNNYVKPDNELLNVLVDANANPKQPYFLILDEMNLSHVERYFADFLSVMESKDKISLHPGDEEWNGVPPKIGFPENLFLIGTVNVDETTYMFSPKVLDRANVIEFSVTADEMKNFLLSNTHLNLDNIEGAGASIAEGFVRTAGNKNLTFSDAERLNDELLRFFNELKKTGAEFGYRSASEILRFAAIVQKVAPDWDLYQITDAAIMQKLLPKVHGSRRKLEPVLKTLGTLCLLGEQTFDELTDPKKEIDYTDTEKIKYPVSLEKIVRMYANLLSNGFTSYAEA